jgi:hypothetical protein
MDSETYRKLIDELYVRSNQIGTTKGHDYATEDKLSNFKRVGRVYTLLRISRLAEQRPALASALNLLILKIDRIINLRLKNAPPKAESVEDSWLDALQYLFLAYACDTEGV